MMMFERLDPLPTGKYLTETSGIMEPGIVYQHPVFTPVDRTPICSNKKGPFLRSPFVFRTISADETLPVHFC